METTIRIKPSELTVDFLEKIKILFKDEDAIEESRMNIGWLTRLTIKITFM